MIATGFASVVLDMDSTLCGIEGVDWLAARRGAGAGTAVAELTERAMRGDIALEAVYGERLALVTPTREDIDALGAAYLETLATGARDAVTTLRAHGRRVVIVSGGLRAAILPLAASLGIPDNHVHAVSIWFTAGRYAGFDTTSPLATAVGKHAVVEQLALAPRVIAVGDGATDLAIRPAVDCFAAYTGFVHRDAVVSAADVVLTSFDQLVELVLA